MVSGGFLAKAVRTISGFYRNQLPFRGVTKISFPVMPTMEEKKTVRELLAERGIPPDRVADRIYHEIIPPPFRVIQSVRLLFGGGPDFAEWNYVRRVADAASWAEVEMAYFNYWLSASREASIIGKAMGRVASRRRPYRFYFKLKYRDLD